MSASREAPINADVLVEDLEIRFPAHYGDIPVVEDVHLQLGRGETLGLIGESGSGKSLIGRAILGLLPPGATVEGRVEVRGVDMFNAGPEKIGSVRGSVVATVFQDARAALNPTRTIGGHLEDVWNSAGEDRARFRAAALEAMELAALPAPERVLASYPHELSGGMRQRALIAIALLRRPSVLIADEPTTALDRIVEDEVLSTLSRLQSELGLSMLLISHDFSVIRRMASRVAVLYAGQVCEIGSAAEVMGTTMHPYTGGLADAVLSLAECRRPLSSIGGTVPSPIDFPSGCRFATRCPNVTPDCVKTRPEVGHGAHRAWCHAPLRGATAVEAVDA